MLVLSRQRDETIVIGDRIEVTVVELRSDKVRLGITAPRDVSVHRKEVYETIRRENRAAALRSAGLVQAVPGPLAPGGARVKTLYARTPGRIDFGGGGTDVAPYCVEHHGNVVNAAINYYAYATLVPREDRQIHLHAQDLGRREVISSLSDMKLEGELDLIKACIRRAGPSRGFELTTYSEIPIGSGLSSSAAIAVAVCAICTQYEHGRFDQAAMAHMASAAERDDLNHWTGKQDQFAAAVGGWNFLEFIGDDVRRTPLLGHVGPASSRSDRQDAGPTLGSRTGETPVPHREAGETPVPRPTGKIPVPQHPGGTAVPQHAGEAPVPHSPMSEHTQRQLEKNLLLVFTGKAHLAGNIHLDILADYQSRTGTVLPGMHGLKAVGRQMQTALREGDLAEFAALLNENWKHHQMLHPSCWTPELQKFMEAGLKSGALGGKVCGAGGGGCIVFYARDNAKPQLARALQEIGGQILPFSFDTAGTIVW